MYICIYRCIKFKLKMINYSKITKVHSKSYSRTNAKDVAVKRSCDNNKRHNETTMITSLSKSEQNVNHQHQCSCSKYLKYCYNTVKTKSNSNSHNGLKCSSSNTNISVNYRSRKCNDIKTNQSLNMSRQKYTKTTAITTGNKANNNSFIVDDVLTLTTTNANAHKHNNTITISNLLNNSVKMGDTGLIATNPKNPCQRIEINNNGFNCSVDGGKSWFSVYDVLAKNRIQEN